MVYYGADYGLALRFGIHTITKSIEIVRTIILITVTVGSLGTLFFIPPIAQDLDYHLFSDTRSFTSIPNFLNVFSNLPFLFVGASGILCLTQKNRFSSDFAWIVFFMGVTLVAFGSSYYHWNPNNETLVWDRLPMTIGFMGLFVALLSEWISDKLKIALLPMCLLGVASVIYWHYFDDLRFYAWIQFFPLLFILLVSLFYQSRSSHLVWLFVGLLFYVGAKISEYFDVEIFALSQNIISGHSIKHLLAACGVYCIVVMLSQRRRLVPQ